MCLDCSESTDSDEDWVKATTVIVGKGVGIATAEELQPTSTYLFKLFAINIGGEESAPSAIATLDTQVKQNQNAF